MNKNTLLLVILLSVLLFPSASAVLKSVTFSYSGYYTWYDDAPINFPTLSYINDGTNMTLIMKNTPQTVLADLNSPWSVESPFFGSNNFWTANNTNDVVTGNTTTVILYTASSPCSDPDDAVNVAQGCIGVSTTSVFGDSIGIDMLLVLVDIIIFVAILARSNSMLLASIVFMLGIVLTVAAFPGQLIRIVILAIVIGATAVIVRLLRRTGA